MTGVSPRWPVRAFAALLALAACVSLLPAQSPSDPPTTPDTAPGGTEASPPLPPYSSSPDASSPLLPAASPMPPRPSIPDISLLPPGTTPAPLATPFPLPVPAQTGAALSPAATGAPPTNGVGTTPATELPGGAASTRNTDAARRFQYAFRLTTGVNYDDNVFLTSNSDSPGVNTQRHGIFRHDATFSIDPSVSLGYGDFLNRVTNYVEVDYTADVLIYVKNTDQDTVQHLFNLQGAYHLGPLTLTLSQGIQFLNSTDLSSNSSGSLLGGNVGGTTSAPNTQVNLDASRRTGLDVYATHLDANYSLSDKTSFDVDGTIAAYEYETLISSETFTVDAFLNYSPTGKLTLGLGGSGGYIIQSGIAPNEFFEQINLRLTYVPTSKLNVAGSVGVEFREIDGADRTEVNPVFDLSITYIPFDSTSLALTASRRTQTSAVLTGQDFDSTGFSFSVSQRFFQRAYLRLSLGYTNSSYMNGGRATTAADRNDDYYYVQPSVDYSLRDNVSVGVFYTHRQSFSSLPGNGFSDNQIGMHVSLSF